MQHLNLNSQTAIPILGFGTWKLAGEQARIPVEEALKIGFRQIDTAEVYENHGVIGEVLKNCGIKREELFITSKVWRDDLKADDLKNACKRALMELKLHYLDLYLIHWPNKNIPMEETLEAMAELKYEGLIKAIGVSNFTINHLKEALKTGVEIANNQVECHPTFNQMELKKFCDENGIVLTAYSPIGQGQDLNLDIVRQLAAKYNAFGSQIILAWHRQRGIVALPRSAEKAHIWENWNSQEITLDDSDMELMNLIPQQKRMLNPPFAEFGD